MLSEVVSLGLEFIGLGCMYVCMYVYETYQFFDETCSQYVMYPSFPTILSAVQMHLIKFRS